MSSPTTSRETAGSTSTSGTGSTELLTAPPKAVPLQRVPLRRKGPTLTAVRATQPGTGRLADGTEVAVQVGDWLVYPLNSTASVAVIPDAEFPGPYEIVPEGHLILHARDREAIDAVAGLGASRTPTDLIRAVQRLARIEIGTVHVPFTPGQLEELKERAVKRGQTVQQALQAVVDRIRDEIFHRG